MNDVRTEFRDHVSDSLAEFEKKVRRAERAQVAAYIKAHADMNILEIADAIAAGVHIRPAPPIERPAIAVDSRGPVVLERVTGSDPRD